MACPLRPIQPAAAAAAKQESSARSDDEYATLTQPHKRKRAPLTLVACLHCREKKTKCDGKRPTCGACTKRRNSDCKYEHLTEAQALREKNAALAQEVERLRTQALGWPVDVDQPVTASFDQAAIEANLFWDQPVSNAQPLQERLDARSQQVLELQNELYALKALLPTLVCSRDRPAALRLVEEIQMNGLTHEARAQADAILRNVLDSDSNMFHPEPAVHAAAPGRQPGSQAGSSSTSDKGSLPSSNGLSNSRSSRTESLEKYAKSPFDPFISWGGMTPEDNLTPGGEGTQ